MAQIKVLQCGDTVLEFGHKEFGNNQNTTNTKPTNQNQAFPFNLYEKSRVQSFINTFIELKISWGTETCRFVLTKCAFHTWCVVASLIQMSGKSGTIQAIQMFGPCQEWLDDCTQRSNHCTLIGSFQVYMTGTWYRCTLKRTKQKWSRKAAVFRNGDLRLLYLAYLVNIW